MSVFSSGEIFTYDLFKKRDHNHLRPGKSKVVCLTLSHKFPLLFNVSIVNMKASHEGRRDVAKGYTRVNKEHW